MANVSYSLEGLIQQSHYVKEQGLTKYDEVYTFLEQSYTTVTAEPENIREVFQTTFPELDVCIPEEQIEARKKLSDAARHCYLNIVTEKMITPVPEDCPRAVETLFRPGEDPESLSYNEKLSNAVSNKDYDTLADMYEEFLKDLPSFDPEDLANLSDEEIPDVFAALHTVYVTVEEARELLTSSAEAEKAIASRLSESSKKQLEEYTKLMDVFSTIKLRCDFIANPHYAYIDTDKILRKTNISDQLNEASAEVDDVNLMRFISNLSSGTYFIHNNVEEVLEEHLAKEGFDLSSVKFRDEIGREYPLKSTALIEGTKTVLNEGKPLFCTAGEKAKILSYQDGSLVSEDPYPFLQKTTGDILSDRLKTADALLNDSVADPFWMITGSSQYRDMKRALSNFQKAVKGQEGFSAFQNEKVSSAAAALESAALEYMKLKGVDLKEFPNFKAFTAYSSGSPMAADMSTRELARMEAAYSVLGLGRDARNTCSLVSDLSTAGVLEADKAPLFSKEEVAEPTRAERIRQSVQEIRSTGLFSEPVAAVGDDTTAEALRQDLNNALFPEGPQKSILSKKIFTAADRQVAEDILAKATILNMIKSWRKTSDSMAPTEQAYKNDPEGTIKEIKQSEAFRKAMGERISPEGMRNFLAESRQATVGKEFLKDVLAKQQVKIQPSAEIRREKGRETEITNIEKNVVLC